MQGRWWSKVNSTQKKKRKERRGVEKEDEEGRELRSHEDTRAGFYVTELFPMTMMIGEKNVRLDTTWVIPLFWFSSNLTRERFPGYKSYFVAMPTGRLGDASPSIYRCRHNLLEKQTGVRSTSRQGTLTQDKILFFLEQRYLRLLPIFKEIGVLASKFQSNMYLFLSLSCDHPPL